MDNLNLQENENDTFEKQKKNNFVDEIINEYKNKIPSSDFKENNN